MTSEPISATYHMQSKPPVRLVVEVCICTHNPRPTVLSNVIAALAAQTSAPEAFRVVLIDNFSEPPLSADVLEPIRRRGVSAHIVVEQALGLTQARLRAARETGGEWICFVDDDNVLAPDYLQAVLDHIKANPNAGAFGGRLMLPTEIEAPRWALPFLPFLGIKDLGDRPQEVVSASWVECEPAGAGAVVHRSVMEAFCQLVAQRPAALSLGRKGRKLSSCDDSALMRCSYRLGRTVGYDPKLTLQHFIDPARLNFGYLLRLMYAYGESQVLLEQVLESDVPIGKHYLSPIAVFRTMLSNFTRDCSKSLPFGVAMLGYHFSAWRTYKRLRMAS